MEIQGECPEFTNDDEIFMQNFRTSDGKSLQDSINLRTNSSKGSMKGGGGACQYTVAVVLSLVAAGVSQGTKNDKITQGAKSDKIS